MVHDVIEPYRCIMVLDVIEPWIVLGSDVIEPIIVGSDVIEPLMIRFNNIMNQKKMNSVL